MLQNLSISEKVMAEFCEPSSEHHNDIVHVYMYYRIGAMNDYCDKNGFNSMQDCFRAHGLTENVKWKAEIRDVQSQYIIFQGRACDIQPIIESLKPIKGAYISIAKILTNPKLLFK